MLKGAYCFNQRTQVQFPLKMLISSQQSVTPTPGDMLPLTSTGSSTIMHIPTCQHTHLHIISSNEKYILQK